ncbi:NUDIX hydrolase [Chryseobacterium indologenes]|uniref:NUDIX domain-containing protein n=1 Tax=Chryseobacterium indologenes TaxID=253 RepID=UPI000B51D40E|nr:NUDIX hydrolase [Chryseobacterium indologenes]ASE60856.1 NUDIX hydrolase [Chryseobacterium indologenes]
MKNNFNIRTYACVIKNNSVLALFEKFMGNTVLKFPGGGLEFGEGLLDCLHREFDEELNVKIKILEHLYTQDHIITSHFKDGRQLLSIYYVAKIMNEENLRIKDEGIEKAEWLPINIIKNPFSLIADQIAFDKLKEKYL